MMKIFRKAGRGMKNPEERKQKRDMAGAMDGMKDFGRMMDKFARHRGCFEYARY